MHSMSLASMQCRLRPCRWRPSNVDGVLAHCNVAGVLAINMYNSAITTSNNKFIRVVYLFKNTHLQIVLLDLEVILTKVKEQIVKVT